MHKDEKGRISPGQSKVARAMSGRSTPLSHRTMDQMAGQHSGHKELRHAFGEKHSGATGMARMAHLKEVNKDKKAKSRVVLRGEKSKVRKTDVRAEKAEHNFKRSMAEVRGAVTNVRKAVRGVDEHKRSRLKVIARGKSSEGRKAYTKIGKKFHIKGLLHVPKVSE